MNDKLQAYIEENQLSSHMNTTKWRELMEAIEANPDYRLRAQVKHVLDNNRDLEFSQEWWLQMHNDWYNWYTWVEWMKIDPIKVEHIGKLVEPRRTDFSNFIRNVLIELNIPYELENGLFAIYGYKRPDQEPRSNHVYY